MKLYLAGKIAPNDWRHSLIHNLRNWDYELGLGDSAYTSIFEDRVIKWPVWPNAILGGHDYVGPYFTSCDHSCAHSGNNHGVFGGCAMPHDESAVRRQIYFQCRGAILICDAVFAWIESPDCHGTIWELGFASAHAKPIFIAGPKYFDELWFTYSSATQIAFQDADELRREWDSLAFLREFLLWCAGGRPDHRAYINSDEWRDIAQQAKARVGWRCQVCNRHKNQVVLDAHHRTYERLGWERLDDITVLCRDCHELFERDRKSQRAQVITLPVAASQDSRRNGVRREKRRSKK